MTAFDNLEKARAIWRLVLDAPVPEDRTLHRWLLSNSVEDFERACSRTQWRFRDEEYDAVKAGAFITSSLAWFRQQRRTR
jgi:hypothetical protein